MPPGRALGNKEAGQEKREASQDNPVARIKVYFVTEDDEFVESDRTVIRNVSELRLFPGLKDRIKKQVSENVAAVLRAAGSVAC